MAYKLNWHASPNFTPGSQTKAFYGQPRSIKGGAGHWWNWPRTGATHDGIVSYMANPARQAAPHAVVSKGRVTEMVREGDTAWCTGAANPYTWAIECDPKIMFKWGYDKPNAAEKALGNAIFETLAEYIADKKKQGIPWKAHNQWTPGTQCNPIKWGEVIARAKQIYTAKYSPKPKPPAVKETARQTYNPLRKMVVAADTYLVKIPSGAKADTKLYKKGTAIDVRQKLTMSNGTVWYRTQYSADKELPNGFKSSALKDVEPPKPEWIKNLKSITPVKLMVLVPQTPIVHLETGKTIKQLGKGTYVDFVKTTKVKGVEYLLSSYSATNSQPNGIRRADVGVPATPPVNEKPSWLDKWQDITDKKMYARADIEVVNLLDGKTVSTIKRGTEVEIASATVWLDKQWLITKYSTDKKLPHGIALVDLSDTPIKDPDTPIPPAPEQPTIEARVSALEKIVEAIKAALAKIGINI